ncbi:MAG TPA: hypothetical protein VFG21_04705 [Xanthomonadaceae bacterium]|nr:hypothetical protein [Xanthomonadaceae bacterium]
MRIMTKRRTYLFGTILCAAIVVAAALVLHFKDLNRAAKDEGQHVEASASRVRTEAELNDAAEREMNGQSARAHLRTPKELIELARAGDVESARTLYSQTYECFEAERNLESLTANAPTGDVRGIGKMMRRLEAQNRACSRFSSADIANGREAMEIAAFNGDADAQSLLLHALSIPQTSDLARSAAQADLRQRLFAYLDARAAAGDPGAMNVLGEALARGTGRERNPVQALGYLMAASYIGGANTEGGQVVPSPRGALIDQLMRGLTPDEIKQAESMALELSGGS